jgi:hypothetical protein
MESSDIARSYNETVDDCQLHLIVQIPINGDTLMHVWQPYQRPCAP